MIFKKDEFSKFEFVSIKEFLLALFLMFASIIVCFISLPHALKQLSPNYESFFDSNYFGIVIFYLLGAVIFYIIYFFTCKKKKKSLQDGLFLYPRPIKTYLISGLIGILLPIVTLPVILQFAPSKFYAMEVAKSIDGMIYIFTAALLAPAFEEIFYRGFVFPFFQSKLNSFWAIIITSIFFGFSHFMNVGNAYILLSVFLIYGFALTLIRYFTNSLIPPIITHFMHNLTLMVSFLVASK